MLTGMGAVLLAILLIVLVYFAATSKTSLIAPFDKDFQTGDDDTPILIELQNSLYTVIQDDKDKKILTVTAFSGYRNTAVKELYDIDQNPTDYKIIFNYENPFKQYE